ncbi:MAG TPA: hypothetical protein VF152_13560, partial [Acidimicrobiia bacterium]
MERASARVRRRVAAGLAAALLAGGVAAFVTLEGGVDSVDESVERFYRRTSFADLVVTGGNAAAFAERARRVDGVAAVETRSTGSLAVWVGDGRAKLEGRLLGLPSARPSVDRVGVRSGRPLAEGDVSVLVERHTADAYDLAPGDRIELLGVGDVVELGVAATGVSPEYLVPAASQQQILTTRGSF